MATYSLDDVMRPDEAGRKYSLSDVVPNTPAEDIGGRVSNLASGVGLGIKAPFIGIGNLIGKVPDERVLQFKQELRDNAQLPGGVGGQIIGGSLPAAAASFLPGGNTVAGSAFYNGVYGAIQPTDSMKERGANALAGATGGVVGQLAGNGIRAATNGFKTAAEQKAAAEASRNSMRDSTLAEGRSAGYVVPRSDYDPSFLSNRLESVGGKAAIKQEATHRNQEVTNALIRKDLGIADDQPISIGALENIRKEAGKVYQEVAALNPIAQSDLEALKQARSDAKQWFTAYNRSADPSQLAKAKDYDEIANMLEQSLEGHASQAGRNELIPALRDARTTIAKTYTAERALNPATGDINARVMGRLYEKQKPLSGGMETVGKFASAFPKFTGAGASTPAAGVSKSEAILGTLLGAGGAAATGSPLGLMAAAIPLLSHPARSMALSSVMQTPKNYPAALIPRIPGMVSRGLPAVGAATGLGLLNY